MVDRYDCENTKILCYDHFYLHVRFFIGGVFLTINRWIRSSIRYLVLPSHHLSHACFSLTSLNTMNTHVVFVQRTEEDVMPNNFSAGHAFSRYVYFPPLRCRSQSCGWIKSGARFFHVPSHSRRRNWPAIILCGKRAIYSQIMWFHLGSATLNARHKVSIL